MTRLTDLTRWNRAGLTRFRYVDGNAAVWMEELRIGMLAQYLRGLPADERLPERWRDLFMKNEVDWGQTPTQAEFAEAVAWAALLPQPPAAPETGGARSRRLVEQYGRRTTDYGWEMMAAFARAAHVLLEHLDAYANEGYLRTASQWENLRKLAAMLNYMPTPPASATTTVALEVADVGDTIEIARGLAMKHARPEGGAPLIFETLVPVLAHAELNAARAVDWDRNATPIDIAVPTTWIAPEKAKLAQGDLAVLAGWDMIGTPLNILTVERDMAAGTAAIAFEPPAGIDPPLYQAGLHVEPDGVRRGLPETSSSQLVLKVGGAASIPANSVVEIRHDGNRASTRAVVAESSGDRLVLSGVQGISGAVEVEAYTPVGANSAGAFETTTAVSTLYFKQTTGGVAGQGSFTVRYDDPDAEDRHAVARGFSRPSNASGIGFANIAGNRTFTGSVVSAPSWSTSSLGFAVRFEGKPPKDLKQGDWYVARPVGATALTALKVVGVRVATDSHHVLFCPAPPASPELTEFFGPMTRRLQPLHHDRNPDPAIVGGIVHLEGLSQKATELVKTGRAMLVVHEDGSGVRTAGQAAITEVEPAGGQLKVTLASETDFSGWEKGWTSFHLNTVVISHGETKDPRILGSGDAEKLRQDFLFKVDTVSFVPSTASVSGVAPDMDVAVAGVRWAYRDLADPAAEGTDAWSVRLNEDDTLQIFFRRRLPTGKNNLSVPRHRAGVGLAGTGVAVWSLTTPMKKNRFVTGIVQPFATTGGADREPVSAVRENAPANLAANGRAVSLQDFERLCERHASVWQAHAREVIGAASNNLLDIVVVPSGGGAVTTALKDDLVSFLLSRALPGVSVTISPYVAVPIAIVITVRVDTARYDKTDVQATTLAALAAAFSLARRDLGQPLYVAEILAEAERVEGVETVVVDSFARKAGAPAPLREAQMSGALAAIFPREEQVVHVTGSQDVAVVVEAL